MKLLKSENGSIKIILVITVLVVILFLVGGMIYQRVLLKSKNAFIAQNNQQSENLPSCPDNKELFSQSPISLGEISTVIPLGNLAPPGHILPTTHMYYRYIHTNLGSKLTNIYAPADITVTKITLSDNNSTQIPFNSYKIEYSLCKEVSGYFILVTTLGDKLKTAFIEPYDRVQTSNVGTAKPDHSYEKNVSLKLSAGELIGTGGGNPNMPDALDVGLTDTRTPIPILANPSRWPDQEQHYVCFADYFPGNIKQALYAKFGDFDGKIIDIDTPKCGIVYQDIPNTAQGVWIAKISTATDLWDVPNNLALVHSNFSHREAVFSFGNIFRQLGIDNSMLYSFMPQTTGKINIDFNNVKPDGKTYCYETQKNQQNKKIVILLQLLGTNTLRIGKLNNNTCGSGPWQFSSYLDFIR